MHRIALTQAGRNRASELLRVDSYVGPVPVSLNDYVTRVRSQSVRDIEVTPADMESTFKELVLDDLTLAHLGTAVVSGRAIILYGPAGTGKTTVAERLAELFRRDTVYLPYAVEVDGQIIKIFDLHNHQPVAIDGIGRYDERWVRIKRPIIVVGGEMTIDTMDLIYSQTARFYEAPFQMKSNGGTLVIDDFGRQRVDPHDLLNRWIVPLEGRVDYLTLHTGKKIEVPFEQLLIFATNLDPDDLVDDAFLRRMGYRLYVNPPDKEMYAKIFKQYVESNGFDYEPKYLDFVYRLYDADKRPLRACEPRDLMLRCADHCKYENLPKHLSNDIILLAWRNYFGAAPTVQ